jgi:hypothetical protein
MSGAGLQNIQQVAMNCVGRAVALGWFAITCVMISFSFDLVSAFRSGAILTLLMSGVLLWKAFAAQTQNPKHTEVWIYLDERVRPADRHSSAVFASIMRDVYGRFCRLSLGVACGLFFVSFVLNALGVEPYHGIASVEAYQPRRANQVL